MSEPAPKNYRYQRIGGLWKSQTKDNRGYLRGRITIVDSMGFSYDYSVSVWPNREKVDGDTKFDFTVDIDTEATKPTPNLKKPFKPTPAKEPPKAAPAAPEENSDNGPLI